MADADVIMVVKKDNDLLSMVFEKEGNSLKYKEVEGDEKKRWKRMRRILTL